MRLATPTLFSALALASTLGAAACTGTDAAHGVIEACYGFSEDGRQSYTFGPCRAFVGQLQYPPAEQLLLGVKPLQLVGLGGVRLDASPQGEADLTGSDGGATTLPPTDQVSRRFFYGDAFAATQGAGQRPTVPFSITVPCEMAINLMVQVVATSGDRAPGLQVAQLQFPKLDGSGELTTLIPGQPADYCGPKTNRLELGIVELRLEEAGRLSSGQILLGSGKSKNPLELVPAPEGDVTEQDQDGDGIIDSAQTFAALPDVRTPGAPPPEDDPEAAQPDGIPDLFQ